MDNNTMNDTQPVFQRSALVIIDTQNDFSLPGSRAEIPGTMDVIPNMTRLLKAYRQYGLPIVHIIRLYLPDGSNADRCRREMIRGGQGFVTPGTSGAEPVSALKPCPDAALNCDMLLKGQIQEWGQQEVVIYKSRWGAFYNTPLNAYLKRLDVDTLVVCGCNFPNCPRTTIYEASERDYRIVMVEDAVSGVYDIGLKELKNIGICLLPTDEIIDQIHAGAESGRNDL